MWKDGAGAELLQCLSNKHESPGCMSHKLCMYIIPVPALEDKDQTLKIIFAYIGFKARLSDIRACLKTKPKKKKIKKREREINERNPSGGVCPGTETWYKVWGRRAGGGASKTPKENQCMQWRERCRDKSIADRMKKVCKGREINLSYPGPLTSPFYLRLLPLPWGTQPVHRHIEGGQRHLVEYLFLVREPSRGPLLFTTLNTLFYQKLKKQGV